MASVKIVLRKEIKADGTSPLAIRITKDRKASYIYLEYSIKPKEWDEKNQRVKKSHPNSVRMNNFLIKKLADATSKALDFETAKSHATAKAVRNTIKPSASALFNAQADSFLNNLRAAGKYNQYTAEKPRVKHFKDFIKTDIAFQDITPGLIERFKNYLITSLHLSERSAVNHLVMLRSIFSYAIKENVIDAKFYPFGKGKVKIKFPDSIKIGLSAEEVKRVEDVELDDPKLNHVRNLWLISFYFAGMRVSDVLRMRWSDIKDNRLHYSMGKNQKGGSLKIPDRALAIIESYKYLQTGDDDLIFPELKGCNFNDKFITQRTIAFNTSAIDKRLRTQIAKKANIDKKLTMHIARHTFGNISGDRIPIQMLQKLYRHSSITTTIGYQQGFIHKDADDALEAVLKL